MSDKITITREIWQKLLKDEIPLSWSNLVKATQEPRKLYAYKKDVWNGDLHVGDYIVFKEDEDSSLIRCPEYDLTFKEGGE